ncbi:unnamed protein product [Schistocephalus solidus]|uniref:Secreted protein n=1 Tax=Schistocephalus solidus TaxID=70667 RepID=A0A183SLA1_SCHSO|nr:unnamed protein product [Schistocephalus solidus]
MLAPGSIRSLALFAAEGPATATACRVQRPRVMHVQSCVAWCALPIQPHLGNDEAVICPTIGITDRLGYQHVLSISPPDENIFQQLPAPRPRVHPRGLLPRRKAEECVGQQSMVFCTRSQKKEAVIVTATETVATQHSLSGSLVCPDVGVEVTKDN